jgi:hypothetical protein
MSFKEHSENSMILRWVYWFKLEETPKVMSKSSLVRLKVTGLRMARRNVEYW